MSPRLMSPQELLRSEERLFILLCLIGGLLVLEPILNRFVAARKGVAIGAIGGAVIGQIIGGNT